MSIIEVKDLTKVFKIPKKEPGLGGAVKGLFRPQYESKTAVNWINFKLDAGEIVGYIGVNGAGKSIMIKMLSGGSIFIALNLITRVTAFWIVDLVPVTRLVFDNHLFAQSTFWAGTMAVSPGWDRSWRRSCCSSATASGSLA